MLQLLFCPLSLWRFSLMFRFDLFCLLPLQLFLFDYITSPSYFCCSVSGFCLFAFCFLVFSASLLLLAISKLLGSLSSRIFPFFLFLSLPFSVPLVGSRPSSSSFLLTPQERRQQLEVERNEQMIAKRLRAEECTLRRWKNLVLRTHPDGIQGEAVLL